LPRWLVRVLCPVVEALMFAVLGPRQHPLDRWRLAG
jgi:hypothetical protein